LGTIAEDSVSNRFHINDVITSEIYVDDMTPEKLDELFEEYKKCCSQINGYALRKSYWLKMNISNNRYYFTEATDEEKQNVYDRMEEDGLHGFIFTDGISRAIEYSYADNRHLGGINDRYFEVIDKWLLHTYNSI